MFRGPCSALCERTSSAARASAAPSAVAVCGTQNIEYFRIHVARSGGNRDGKHVEMIGNFWPQPRWGAEMRGKLAPSCCSRAFAHDASRGHPRSAPPRRHDGNLHLSLNFTRAKYWLAQGAEPTPTVRELLRRVGLMPDERHPERFALAPVSPVHVDAGAGRGLPGVDLLPRPGQAAKARAAMEAAVREDGTLMQQRRRREQLWAARREVIAGQVGGRGRGASERCALWCMPGNDGTSSLHPAAGKGAAAGEPATHANEAAAMITAQLDRGRALNVGLRLVCACCQPVPAWGPPAGPGHATATTLYPFHARHVSLSQAKSTQ